MPLGMRAPLANNQQAQYALLRQRAFLQQIVHQTTHSLARFFLEVDANYKQFKTASRLRAAAAQRLEAQKAFYEEGRITIDRYLDAVSQFADAVAQEAQFKTTYNISIVALEEAKGTLLAYDNIAVAEGPSPRKAYIQARDQQAAHASCRSRPTARTTRGRSPARPIPTRSPRCRPRTWARRPPARRCRPRSARSARPRTPLAAAGPRRASPTSSRGRAPGPAEPEVVPASASTPSRLRPGPLQELPPLPDPDRPARLAAALIAIGRPTDASSPGPALLPKGPARLRSRAGPSAEPRDLTSTSRPGSVHSRCQNFVDPRVRRSGQNESDSDRLGEGRSLDPWF